MVVQLVPFHCSATGVVKTEPALLGYDPTAVHALSDEHDTAVSPTLRPAGQLGMVCTVQLVPFHRSANVERAPELVLSPTAVHAVADGHEIPSSSLSSQVDESAVDWIVHVVPFHRSANAAV